MYFKELSKREKHKKKRQKVMREQRSPFAYDHFPYGSTDSFPQSGKNLKNMGAYSSFNTFDKSNYDHKARKKENFSEDYVGNKASKGFNKLLDKKSEYSKVEVKQILKIVSALLLVVTANETFADFDIDAAIKAAATPVHKGITDWWPFGIGIPACIGAMIGEGDLRTRAKSSGIGAVVGMVVTLGLLGGMGDI